MTNDTVNEIDAPEKIQPFISMTTANFVKVLTAGAVTGAATWLLQVVLHTYVFTPLFCRQGVSADVCSSAAPYSWYFAIVIAAVAGLFVLTRQLVYRPLLVVLAATISLWGLWEVTNKLPWYAGLIVFALMFAVIYGLFTWVARLRMFWLAVFVSAVVVVLLRLTLTA